MMPGMDGFEFLAELRKNEAWQALPVVVLTSKDLTPKEQRRLNGNVEKVLQKGAYGREELLGEVRRVLPVTPAARPKGMGRLRTRLNSLRERPASRPPEGGDVCRKS